MFLRLFFPLLDANSRNRGDFSKNQTNYNGKLNEIIRPVQLKFKEIHRFNAEREKSSFKVKLI